MLAPNTHGGLFPWWTWGGDDLVKPRGLRPVRGLLSGQMFELGSGGRARPELPEQPNEPALDLKCCGILLKRDSRHVAGRRQI